MVERIEDGGPAFARPMVPTGSNAGSMWTYSPAQDGMSLRDWFAGQALNGLCASSTFDLPDEQWWAAQVYKFADAMLSARSKKGGE